MASSTGAEPMYAITLHQPWASLIALEIKMVEPRSWPATARLVGRRIAVLAGMARVARTDLSEGCAVHDPGTEVGCAVGTRRTPIDPWGDFRCGPWLWFLDDVEALPERSRLSAGSPSGAGSRKMPSLDDGRTVYYAVQYDAERHIF